MFRKISKPCVFRYHGSEEETGISCRSETQFTPVMTEYWSTIERTAVIGFFSSSLLGREMRESMSARYRNLSLSLLAHFEPTIPQVTTSNGQVKSRSVHLDVVPPEAIILSTDEYRIEKGSLISLVCILENALLPPEYVFWYQNDRMINYDTSRGVTVTTTQGKKTSSRLNIQK